MRDLSRLSERKLEGQRCHVSSLRSKRFRGAKSEEETGFSASCPSEKWGASKNKKEGYETLAKQATMSVEFDSIAQRNWAEQEWSNGTNFLGQPRY